MSLARGDRSLREELDWAIDRLAKAGYPIRSEVRLLVDPNLDIMGYASEEGTAQHIVIAEWALQSDMLGGLLFHELAHIYHTERRSPSHNFKATNAIITEFSRREGLNERETGYLVEGFSHLQNVIVDDIVFEAMDEGEKRQAQSFFAGWLTDSPSGYSLADASALARNAFAIASLKRHGLLGDAPLGDEIVSRAMSLARQLGRGDEEKYRAVEDSLVNVHSDWDEETFHNRLAEFLDLLLALLREGGQMEDMR